MAGAPAFAGAGTGRTLSTQRQNTVTDLRGASRLAIDAIAGITALVEALHMNIARAPTAIAGPVGTAVNATTSAVYGTITGITRVVGGSIDLALGALAGALREQRSPPLREALVAAVNGVLGDHLADTGNPLAIPTQFRRGGQPLPLAPDALAAALPAARPHIVLLVHGLCMNDLQWQRKGHDHGVALEQALPVTSVWLRYNSGRHISTNGRELSTMLEALVAAWPVPVQSLSIVGHSMGGLVARSAVNVAQEEASRWPSLLRTLVFLGTPHLGAPLERGGHWIDLLLEGTPYTAPFARLGKVRSAGITDLRHGDVRDEDWQGGDRFGDRNAAARPLALPDGVDCRAVAGTLADPASATRRSMMGDGLVPVASALGQHRDARLSLQFPEDHRVTVYNTGHLDLLQSPEVQALLQAWLAPPAADAG